MVSVPAISLGAKRGKGYVIDDAEKQRDRSAVKENDRKRKAPLSLKGMSTGHAAMAQRVFLHGRNSLEGWERTMEAKGSSIFKFYKD